MKEFTIPMALADYIPVIFFALASIYLQRDLYNKMSKGAFALFAAGTIDVIMAGALKATYKLLYAAGVCDFEPLTQMFFPVNSIGFLLAGIGTIALFTHKQGNTASLAAVAPAAWSGTFLFIALMVAGLGFIEVGLCILAVRLKKPWLILLFVISFICSLGMGYLSSKNFAEASMNWIAEGVNIVGQCTLFLGAFFLRRAGLRDYQFTYKEKS